VNDGNGSLAITHMLAPQTATVDPAIAIPQISGKRRRARLVAVVRRPDESRVRARKR